MIEPTQPPNDVDQWRNRFILVNFVRIGGTVIVLLGLLIWHSDWWRDGGAVDVGLPLAIAGLAVSFGGPILLAKRWRTPRQ